MRNLLSLGIIAVVIIVNLSCLGDNTTVHDADVWSNRSVVLNLLSRTVDAGAAFGKATVGYNG